MNYPVLYVLQEKMLLFVSRGSGVGGKCWMQYTEHKNPSHTDMFGTVSKWSEA